MLGESERTGAGVPRPQAGVSVVTVVRNGGPRLERTIRSVLEQTCQDLDYLIVDGDSTDGTQELIRRFEGRLRWISEPDRGLYDAMNKGLARVTDPGRYLLFLNGDDVLAAPDALERMLAGADGADLVHGRLERHDEELDYHDVVGGPITPRGLTLGMIPHQSLLCRRRVFDRVGGFDLRYRIAADFDWLLRAVAHPEHRLWFVPVVVATSARGGMSDREFPRLVRERWDSLRRHRSMLDLARYTAYAALVELPRFAAQVALRRLGLLNQARDVKRHLLGRATR